ncbi:MAG: thioredoxin [Thermoproteota archaeon]|nr:MAG: thioredoxin [Candidatus Korarchaeota archaeon]RLG51233.1 MAG: thioredoxin [Candidatus Korarchaeota archaeon]
MDELEELKRRKLAELLRRASEPRRELPMGPVELDSSSFWKFVRENRVAVVDFWAEWCMPCRIVAPVIEELSRKYAGRVAFGKLNVDESPEIAAQLQIMAIPTLVLFIDGKPVDRLTGAYPKPAIERWISRYV